MQRPFGIFSTKNIAAAFLLLVFSDAASAGGERADSARHTDATEGTGLFQSQTQVHKAKRQVGVMKGEPMVTKDEGPGFYSVRKGSGACASCGDDGVSSCEFTDGEGADNCVLSSQPTLDEDRFKGIQDDDFLTDEMALLSASALGRQGAAADVADGGEEHDLDDADAATAFFQTMVKVERAEYSIGADNCVGRGGAGCEDESELEDDVLSYFQTFSSVQHAEAEPDVAESDAFSL